MYMSSKYLVPQSILERLFKDKKVLLVEFDNFFCVIDGNMLNEDLSGFDELDLNFSIDKDETLSAMVDGRDVFQLHFNHEGEMPGPIIFRIKAEGYKKGDTLYLYYIYQQAGVVEALQEVVVDEEGYMTLIIYHCSSYVITDTKYDDAINSFGSGNEDMASMLAAAKATEVPTPPPTPEPTKAPVNTTIIEVKNETVTDVSGVPLFIFIYCLIGIAALSSLITLLATVKKRRRNH